MFQRVHGSQLDLSRSFLYRYFHYRIKFEGFLCC